jgi:hypothetical protein
MRFLLWDGAWHPSDEMRDEKVGTNLIEGIEDWRGQEDMYGK